ncbi:Phosphate acyltransferase [bioreactor metagenome]|uniref:phosphate acyltransferase n=1 Tax=bioreactor metagenome TaxID=1076179 RepID=A0A645IDB0_9ZZZZ
MILKMYEGVAAAMLGSIKNIFKKSFITKLSALLVMGAMKDFKKQMDYKDYGGAPLLGVQKPVIKAHGSSDARAFYNAIRQGITCVQKDVTGQIASFVKTDDGVEN